MKEETKARRWFTYMVRCRDGSLYTGFTVDDVARRVARHNAGKGARYTAARRPVTLVWQKEWPTQHDARSAEAKLKRLPKAEKEKVVSGQWSVSSCKFEVGRNTARAFRGDLR